MAWYLQLQFNEIPVQSYQNQHSIPYQYKLFEFPHKCYSKDFLHRLYLHRNKVHNSYQALIHYAPMLI